MLALATKADGGGTNEERETGPRAAADAHAARDKLLRQMARARGAHATELARDLSDIQERHLVLRRHFKALYLAYRSLRYQVEEVVSRGGSASDLPMSVKHEDSLLASAPNDILHAEQVRC